MPVHHLASWRRTGHRGERRALDDDGESARRCSPAADERIMNELARGAPLASFTPVNSTKSKVTNHEHLRQASNRTAGPLSAARARRPGCGVGATGHYRTGSPSTRPEDGSLPAPPTASLPPPSREGPSGRHCARPPPSAYLTPSSRGATSSPRSASSVSPPGDRRPSPWVSQGVPAPRHVHK